MRHAVPAFLLPCLAIAACLRADAVYTFGEGVPVITVNEEGVPVTKAELTMYVGQTISVPLYLHCTGDEQASTNDKDPFLLIRAAVWVPYPDPIPDDLPVELAGVEFNPLLGSDQSPGVARDYKLILYGKEDSTDDFGGGNSVDSMGDSSRVLIATLQLKAFVPGQTTFQTETWDANPSVQFSNKSFADIPGFASLQLTVLPTAVPLPAACWGGLALLGVTVAARVRSAFRR